MVSLNIVDLNQCIGTKPWLRAVEAGPLGQMGHCHIKLNLLSASFPLPTSFGTTSPGLALSAVFLLLCDWVVLVELSKEEVVGENI